MTDTNKPWPAKGICRHKVTTRGELRGLRKGWKLHMQTLGQIESSRIQRERDRNRRRVALAE